ncbi:MAG TPA: hypothetical protein VGG01_07105 [Xanthobacteraceae bacterium]|jgi:hypothetical protein
MMATAKLVAASRLPSPELVFAELRLEEQFCERLASCAFPDRQSAEHSVSFSTCLTSERDRQEDG